MEHKFGVFNSVEELNRAAAAQKAEGDVEALKALAAENGIDEWDVEAYLNGTADELATPYIAAIGKLELEAAELGLKSQLKDWKNHIVLLCTENESLSRAVFSPDKHLLDVLAKALKFASTNRVLVPRTLSEKAGLGAGSVYIGMTSKEDLRRIVNEYYLGGAE